MPRLQFHRRSNGSTLKNPPAQKYRSLALKRILSRCNKKIRILDLGAARSANFKFFTGLAAELTIADVYAALKEQRSRRHKLKGNARNDLWQHEAYRNIFPYATGTRFNLVLAWDLFNYLTRCEIGGLMERIHRFCEPGTSLYALIATNRKMASQPIHFNIVDNETLLYQSIAGQQQIAPLYLEKDLLKMMPGLAVENRILLRNGMLEYWLTYRHLHGS